MAVSVGDQVPNVEAHVLVDGAPSAVQTGDVLGSGKVVVFAVPGAFTPGCSNVHLPGFVNRAADLSAKGVDKIVCVAVNDAWVMGAWAESQNAEGITMLADGNGKFAEAMGLELDGAGAGLGSRSQRYAMVIEDGVIKNLDVEEGGAIEASTCDAVIGRL